MVRGWRSERTLIEGSVARRTLLVAAFFLLVALVGLVGLVALEEFLCNIHCEVVRGRCIRMYVCMYVCLVWMELGKVAGQKDADATTARKEERRSVDSRTAKRNIIIFISK